MLSLSWRSSGVHRWHHRYLTGPGEAVQKQLGLRPWCGDSDVTRRPRLMGTKMDSALRLGDITGKRVWTEGEGQNPTTDRNKTSSRLEKEEHFPALTKLVLERIAFTVAWPSPFHPERGRLASTRQQTERREGKTGHRHCRQRDGTQNAEEPTDDLSGASTAQAHRVQVTGNAYGEHRRTRRAERAPSRSVRGTNDFDRTEVSGVTDLNSKRGSRG